MKRYSSRAVKFLAIISLACGAVFLTGIVLLLLKIENIGLSIGLTVGSGLLGILFLSCFVAEKSRYITIDDKKIVLPRGANINEKISFSRTIINTNEIRSIKSELHKGDGIIAADTLFHTLTLKDGTRIKFTLYAYGKDAENEILETIKRKKV